MKNLIIHISSYLLITCHVAQAINKSLSACQKHVTEYMLDHDTKFVICANIHVKRILQVVCQRHFSGTGAYVKLHVKNIVQSTIKQHVYIGGYCGKVYIACMSQCTYQKAIICDKCTGGK